MLKRTVSIILCFILLFSSIPAFSQNIIIGDVDQNGGINTTDLALLKKHLAALITLPCLSAADCDLSEKIDTTDLALLKHHLADSSVELGKITDYTENRSVNTVHRDIPTEYSLSSKLSEDNLIYYDANVSDEQYNNVDSMPYSTVISYQDILAAAEIKKASAYGSVSVVDVNDTSLPFTKAVHFEITSQAPNAYSYTLRPKNKNQHLAGGAADGDVLLLIVYVRHISGGNENGCGRMQFIAQKPAVYTRALQAEALQSADEGWQKYYFPFIYKQDHTDFDIRLSAFIQTMEFGGLEVRNYGSDVSFSDFPNADQLKYYDSLADWRQEAIDNINQNRKDTFNIKVVDKDGNPVENAKITLNMYEHEFQWGIAAYSSFFNNQSFKTLAPKLFNSGVVANELKWRYFETETAVGMSMIKSFKELGMKNVRGHCLFWDRTYTEGNSSVPDDLPNLYDDKEQLMNRILTHIEDEMTYYQGELCDWDVANELAYCNTVQSLYSRDILKDIFATANKYNSGEDLYYNETVRGEVFFEILDWMEENEINYDGIGIQSHYSSLTEAVNIYSFLQRVNTYGKKMKITEYDYLSYDDNIKANVTRDIILAAFSFENMDGFYSWTFKGGDFSKGIFYYDDYTPRLSTEVFTDLVYNKFRTRGSGNTNQNGEFSFDGFFGSYDIVVLKGNKRITVSADCFKESDREIIITIS